jgi:hypothetical protein
MEISLLVGAGLQWQTRSVRQHNRAMIPCAGRS